MLKLIILNVLLSLHPVHVTLTTIEQAKGNDTMRVFVRMYYDDFLRDLHAQGKTNISLKDSIPDDNISGYFNDRVRIYINNKLITGRLISQWNDKYEITFTLSYKSNKDPVKFKIIHQILTGIYSDQANMIYLNINNYQEALKLTCDDFSAKRDLR